MKPTSQTRTTRTRLLLFSLLAIAPALSACARFDAASVGKTISGSVDSTTGGSVISTPPATWTDSPPPTTPQSSGNSVNVNTGAYSMINAASFGFHYAYAPSIISANGQLHAYFCSTGSGSAVDWDHIRHSVSSDGGSSWSAPDDLLQSNPVERANCDPSIVRFDRGDGPYYYLYYGGSAANIQGLNFVARSSSPSGPFLKYTDRGTWERQPADSHAIIWPIKNGGPDSAGVYGSGQPSVVVKNGKMWMWHNDTSAQLPTQVNQIYLRTSTDGLTWTGPQATNVTTPSIDVKYDAASDQFAMFEILDEHSASSRLAIRTSDDGVTWTDPTVICDVGCFPKWANNVGASGDDQGHLIAGQQTVVSFGAPYNLAPTYDNDCAKSAAPYCWGYWSLYGMKTTISLAGTTPSTPRDSALIPIRMNSTMSNDALWPSDQAIDGRADTAYSSAVFASSVNDRATYLASWVGVAPKVVQQIWLGARYDVDGATLGFPKLYEVYLTSPDNSSWQLVGTYSVQPGADHVAAIQLDAARTTYGVMIKPVSVGTDGGGGHYFQLGEIGLAGPPQ